MLALPLDIVDAALRPIATYAAATLHALAREEAAGRKPRRLTEPELASWSRFRGRLNSVALLEVLLEDAAVTQPVPFDRAALPGFEGKLSSLPEDVVDGWLRQVHELELGAAPQDYIQAQAKLLGVPSRGARSDLPSVKPHHRVLELPSTGGQLAHFLVDTNPELYLQDVFTIACAGWEEMTLAGLVAVERGLSGPPPVLLDPDLEQARQCSVTFDFVIGLDPDKGGDFEKPLLESRFPKARIVLV